MGNVYLGGFFLDFHLKYAGSSVWIRMEIHHLIAFCGNMFMHFSFRLVDLFGYIFLNFNVILGFLMDILFFFERRMSVLLEIIAFLAV